MLRSSLLLLVLTHAFPGDAEAVKRGMIPSDYLTLELASDPRISPDGRLVAFTLGTIDQKRSRRASNIWVTSADASRPAWQLTTTSNSTHPRWSPDGKSLAFLSNRAVVDAAAGAPTGNQIYLLSLSGGEAVRLTEFPSGVSDFEWSSDGAHLACVSKSNRVRSRPQSDVRHYSSSIYKYDSEGWYDGERAHIWIVDVHSKGLRQVSSGDGSDDSDPRWSPDGSKLAYMSHSVLKYRGIGGAILVVSAEGGSAIRISDQGGSPYAPRWSHDGKRLAYIASPNDSDDARIWLASSAGGKSKLASRKLETIPVDLEWTASDQVLLFTGQGKGEQQFFRMNLSSGDISPMTSGQHYLDGADVNEKTRMIAYVQADPVHVGDVYVSDLSGCNARQLSRTNLHLYSDVALQNAESVQYPVLDGLTVEGFFMRPVGWQADRTYPMILCIHGGPAGMWGAKFYPDFQMLVARGWGVLYLNPRGSSGYGEKFQRAGKKEWGGKVYDDLMRGVDYALQKYPIDRTRLGVQGGSFGGFMTNWIVGHTNQFKAAVTISGISNFTSLEGTRDLAYSHAEDFGGDLFQNFAFYWNQSPLKYASEVKTPTLILHGDADHRVPLEQSEQWFRALRHFNAPAEFVIFPGENHTYSANPKHRVDLSSWQVYWFGRFLNENESLPAPDVQ